MATGELAGFGLAGLPGYMVLVIAVLPMLRLTCGGEVGWAALPAPGRVAAGVLGCAGVGGGGGFAVWGGAWPLGGWLGAQVAARLPVRLGGLRELFGVWLVGISAVVIGECADGLWLGPVMALSGAGGCLLLVAKMISGVGEVLGCCVPLLVFVSALALVGGVSQRGPVQWPSPSPVEPDGQEEFGGGIDTGALADAAAVGLLAVLAGDGGGW